MEPVVTTLGWRVKTERLRLGMTQSAFAAVAGVTLNSQIRYEKGGRTPDADYLAAVAAAGVDVLYVITGQRSTSVAAAATLPPDEQAILSDYRSSDRAGKALIRGVSSNAAKIAGAIELSASDFKPA